MFHISIGFAPTRAHYRTTAVGTHLKGASANEEESYQYMLNRRNIFQLPIQLTLLSQLQSVPVHAATGEMVKGPLTVEEAEDKFRRGYKTINYLLDHYDEICEGGGDNVRRYLGTIVSNPPSELVGIGKTMVALEDKADDFIEYKETSEEVIKSINQADGSAYMAIFVTTSTSYTPPKKYFDDGKIEVKRCKAAMEQVADMVGIKL